MKKRPRQKRMGLSPVEKAQLKAHMEREVRETFTAAQIHAMTGGDAPLMVNKVGRIFYVVLTAAVTDELDDELADIRILRGASNAMYDQVGEDTIPPARRASIVSGLEACGRLMAELEYDSVVDAAFKLHIALEYGPGVDWRHYQELVERLKVAT